MHARAPLSRCAGRAAFLYSGGVLGRHGAVALVTRTSQRSASSLLLPFGIRVGERAGRRRGGGGTVLGSGRRDLVLGPLLPWLGGGRRGLLVNAEGRRRLGFGMQGCGGGFEEQLLGVVHHGLDGYWTE